MSEDVARAVGADGASVTSVKIAGIDVVPRPLTIKELTEVERDCLKRYSRRYLESYRDNLDLLSEANRDRIMSEKIEEVAKWDMTNLPTKSVVDFQKVVLTDRLKDWVKNYFIELTGSWEPPEQAAQVMKYYKKLTGALIDQGIMSEDDYTQLTNAKLPKTAVPYIAWWITGSMDGRITMLWMLVKAKGVSRDDVENDPLVVKNHQKIMELANQIESLSAPDLKNG